MINDAAHTTTIENGSEFSQHSTDRTAAMRPGVGSGSSVEVNLDPAYRPYLPLVGPDGRTVMTQDAQPAGTAVAVGAELSHADRAARGVQEPAGDNGTARACESSADCSSRYSTAHASYTDEHGRSQTDVEYSEELHTHVGAARGDGTTVTEGDLRNEQQGMQRRGAYSMNMQPSPGGLQNRPSAPIPGRR